MGAEVFHALQEDLQAAGHSTAVGDEGGFAPDLRTAEEALEIILEAIEQAGLPPGERHRPRPRLGARSSSSTNGQYDYTARASRATPAEHADYLAELVDAVPDRLHRGRHGRGRLGRLEELTDALGDRCQLVGDDLFVTNADAAARRASRSGVANSVLVKVNQIGTLTETLAAVAMAHEAGYTAVISHRSGETEDTTIADLAVATGCRPDQDRLARPAPTAWRSTTSCSGSRRSWATRRATRGARHCVGDAPRPTVRRGDAVPPRAVRHREYGGPAETDQGALPSASSSMTDSASRLADVLLHPGRRAAAPAAPAGTRSRRARGWPRNPSPGRSSRGRRRSRRPSWSGPGRPATAATRSRRRAGRAAGRDRRPVSLEDGEQHEADADGDEQLPVGVPAGPVDDQVGRVEGQERDDVAAGQPERPLVVRAAGGASRPAPAGRSRRTARWRR